MPEEKPGKTNHKVASFDPSRREFLRYSTIMGGAGLTLGLSLPGCSAEQGDEARGSGEVPEGFSPSVWLTVREDNRVFVYVAEAEMGQGVMTALPMLVAEEMDLDWQQVEVVQAPVEPQYGSQMTGGSTSVRHAWQPLREAGATARQALLEAAAAQWQVPVAQCQTSAGRIVCSADGREVTYGQIAEFAAKRELPVEVSLKLPRDYRIIGRSIERNDLRNKLNGQAVFGIDTQVEGMRVAVMARPPKLGQSVTRVDDKAALAISGVEAVINLGTGVAVVATGYWQADMGRQALAIDWNSAVPQVDSEQIEKLFRARLDMENARPKAQIGAGTALNGAEEGLVEALYRLPLQAHATMEPMNCTAWFHGGLCEVWVPTQAPTRSRSIAADGAVNRLERTLQKIELRLTGKQNDPVLIHTTLMGGGFGRRAEIDFVRDAVEIARQVSFPVKLIYSRADDFRADYFRPPTLQRLRVRLDEQGTPEYWHHRLVSNTDSTSGAVNLPYAIKNQLVDVQQVEIPHLRKGWWRSVAHSYTAFAVESFVDELAHQAEVDPLTYRLKLAAENPRFARVLSTVAEMADWHNSSDHRFLGIAGHEGFGSIAAQVVELKRAGSGRLQLTRVYCAFDCGQVVNPDIVEAQLEGSIIYALTSALKSQITVKNSQVEQLDFVGFPLLRYEETPEIVIRLIDSQASPGGVGEPGVPPLLPALANALYMATGERYRQFPVADLPLTSGRA